MKKIAAMIGLITLGLTVAGCSSNPEPTKAPAEAAPKPTATETADPTNGIAFGEDVTLDYAGSVWKIRIEEPRDVTEDVAKQYEGTGLEMSLEDGMTYIGVPGNITRVGDGPGEPFGEVDAAVVDGRVIDSDSQSLDDPPALMDVDEMFPGSDADFVQIFKVATGTELSTVGVYVGMGEATQMAFFGEPVDLGSEEGTSTSEDVETMKSAWDASTPGQQAESRTSWDLDDGKVTDQGVAQLIKEASEHGVMLDEAEAREFLEWVLTQ